MVKALDERGARPLVAPSVELVPARSAALTRALRDLAAGRYAWITLTSRATVEMLATRLSAPSDVRAKVAVIGDGTAAAFRRWARRDPDLQPTTFTTAALARAFPRGKGRVLCPRADIASRRTGGRAGREGLDPRARRRLPHASAAHPAEGGARRVEGGQRRRRHVHERVDGPGFVGALGPVRGAPKVVCIGPVTAREARAHGLTVHAVAAPHTMEGLVAALERVFAKATGATTS